MSLLRTSLLLPSNTCKYLIQPIKCQNSHQWLRYRSSAVIASTLRGNTSLKASDEDALQMNGEFVIPPRDIDRSNDDPEVEPESRLEELRREIQSKLRDIEEELTITISRHLFRELSHPWALRRLILQHFKACSTVKDIYRVVAVAVQRRTSALALMQCDVPLSHVFHQARGTTSDKRIASAMIGLISYLRIKGLPVPPALLFSGIRFGARSRSLRLMKRFLAELKRSNVPMTLKVFRSTIAKFSVGTRGFGEIRNGRWKRSDLLTVLLGPLHDESKGEAPCHLETFMNRNEWRYLHGWIFILARCRATDAIWREWELWRDSLQRREGHRLTRVRYVNGHRISYRARGDTWFVRHLLIARSPKIAWKCFGESGLGFFELSKQVRSVLLENLEFATVWNKDMQKELLRKYEDDLEEIESRLGMKWVRMHGENGYHRPTPDMEVKLEQLSRPGYFKIHGFFNESQNDSIEDQAVRKYKLTT